MPEWNAGAAGARCLKEASDVCEYGEQPFPSRCDEDPQAVRRSGFGLRHSFLLTRRVRMNSDLIPRAYQLEILAKAQEGNVIAAIDTGSGKVRAHGLRLAQSLA